MRVSGKIFAALLVVMPAGCGGHQLGSRSAATPPDCAAAEPRDSTLEWSSLKRQPEFVAICTYASLVEDVYKFEGAHISHQYARDPSIYLVELGDSRMRELAAQVFAGPLASVEPTVYREMGDLGQIYYMNGQKNGDHCLAFGINAGESGYRNRGHLGIRALVLGEYCEPAAGGLEAFREEAIVKIQNLGLTGGSKLNRKLVSAGDGGGYATQVRWDGVEHFLTRSLEYIENEGGWNSNR